MQKLNPIKIETLLSKLATGKSVSKRDLENILGLDGLVEYEDLWQQELNRRVFFETKPEALAEYENMLKCADLLAIRAERIATVKSAKNLCVLAEAQYQAALAYLKGYIDDNEIMAVWLDRNMVGLVGIKPNQMPRLVTSISKYKLTEGDFAKTSKEAIKCIVLKNALARLEAADNTEAATEHKAKLKVMLAHLIKCSKAD